MAAAEGGGETGPGLSVAELLLNMSHFGMGSSPDTSASAEDDPELHEALSRSMRESEAESKLPPPASRRAVTRLPSRRWRSKGVANKEGSGDDTCAVCSELYAEGEEVTWMPCHHVFHASCLRPWLQVGGPRVLIRVVSGVPVQ